MSTVFEPGYINKLELKNRIWMLAMHTGFAQKGVLTKRDFEFYKARAKGGAAAITTVAAISSQGKLKGMPVISEDGVKEKFGELREILNEFDTKLFIQLFHCGRNGSEATLDGKKPIAPSAIASPIYKAVPAKMTKRDIENVISQFKEGARLSKESGAHGIEISGTVGYLLTQFLSPLTNRRDDEYGGNDENRMRFSLEVLRAVRNEVGLDYPVILRVSGAQMQKGGYGIDTVIDLCKKAEEENLIDAISVTVGWHEASVPLITYHVPPGAYSYLADAIKRSIDLPIIASNRINNINVANKMLKNLNCDFVGTARGFLADPEFASKLELGKTHNICQGCMKCIERIFDGKDIECAYNPEAGKEYLDMVHRKVATAKKVLVIGGGPAGLISAKKAAQRGYKVTLCTDDSTVGGQLNLACIPPDKHDISLFVENIYNELTELEVTIKYNMKVDEKFIRDFNPYFVVVATGSSEYMPNIDGIEKIRYYNVQEVLNGDAKIIETIKKGKTVIIGGGATGIDVARYIAQRPFADDSGIYFMNKYFSGDEEDVFLPCDITIVEEKKSIGDDLGSVKWIVKNAVKESGIKVITNMKVTKITESLILLKDKDIHETLSIEVDNIIVATGRKPIENSFINFLQDERISYSIVGDCDEPRDVMHALKSAYDVFLRVFIV